MAEGPEVESRRTHHVQAKRALGGLIAQLTEDGETRLPAEDQLSRDLRFSRPTIRSALLSLQKEGKIQRLHGRGTFINRHALSIRANLAEDRPFLSLLESLGHEARVRNLSIGEVELAEPEWQRLELGQPDTACEVRRVFEGSGRPAAYTVDHVPMRFLEADIGEVDGRRSTFEFVRRWTSRPVRYSVAEFCPVTVDEGIAEVLEVPVGAAVLLLDHLHIDEYDRPVAVTRAYLNDELIHFSSVRAYSLV